MLDRPELLRITCDTQQSGSVRGKQSVDRLPSVLTRVAVQAKSLDELEGRDRTLLRWRSLARIGRRTPDSALRPESYSKVFTMLYERFILM